MARWLIEIGGVSVILAVVMIFFYLLVVVFPLFTPASSTREAIGSRPEWAAVPPVYLAIEEQLEVGLRIDSDGEFDFFRVEGGQSLLSDRLLPDEAGAIQRVVHANEPTGLLAVATTNGEIFLVREEYETRYDGGLDQKQIVPEAGFPYGDEAVLTVTAGSIQAVALSEGDRGVALAALDDSGEIAFLSINRQENLLTGEVTFESSRYSARVDEPLRVIALNANQTALYAGDSAGRVHFLSLPALEIAQTVDLSGAAITAMTMLTGGISVLAGDAQGRISQLFPVRDDENQFSLELIRQFTGGNAPIAQIITEQRRKGFVTLDEEDGFSIFHSTAGQQVLAESLADLNPRAIALSPRADGLLVEGSNGALSLIRIDNDYPEVSLASLWQKVWYENYSEPAYIWQSSAATNEFEPKFSLTPLVFGTLKAALYAMLFAIPLALMGAAYTAYFMAPRLRQIVKPGIEIMAALPTVILGFLAGLWFAPFVEENLAGIFALMVIIPPGVLLFAWFWQHHDSPLTSWVPEGWEPLLQLPVLVVLGAFALWAAEPLELALFGMPLTAWLSQEAGIEYDQRNALVVGCAMGFAVIPSLFSIAEDAIFGVPRSLSNGSLALGATPWQSLMRVVIPTASPGIFSALMIALGRAVGETMIVLMATGNTPIMDWNLFEGMRTLAANIAVEMPESEVGSSHYRILFLAALVLFLFTFVVNTGAELVRQRLRERYSSL